MNRVFFALVALLLAGTEGRHVTEPQGTAIAGQTSEVHGGAGTTGISNGNANAKAQGGGGALSDQKSIATGGRDSSLISDGTSTASASGNSPGLINGIHSRYPQLSGRPAIANQHSLVHGGTGTTGVASGHSNAQGGLGGAISNQGSSAYGGRGSTLISDGTSDASTTGARGGKAFQFPDHRVRPTGGVAIAKQNSQAHTGAFGTADAQGLAKAQGQEAIAKQHSGATAGVGGAARAGGTAVADTPGGFFFRKRRYSAGIADQIINRTVGDIASKAKKDRNAIIASSTVNASNE